MKKIIVTGCNGQLGRAVNEFYKDAADLGFVNTDVAELDITDIDAVMRLAREVKPYAIINCAAHTGVDACETQYEKAFAINAIGPRNLAIAARETGAKLVHISTDYVFDGKKTSPYVETDPTNPQGAYGSTKLAGEQFVKQFADRWFILRTAWLYGDGKNFVRTMLRLSQTISSDPPPALQSWPKPFIPCCFPKITASSTPPVREAAAGRSLRRRSFAWRESVRRWRPSPRKNTARRPPVRPIPSWTTGCSG